MKQVCIALCMLCLVIARNYNKYEAIDCPGNDIRQDESRDPNELMKICDATQDCIGFNSNGWLKKKYVGISNNPEVNMYLIDSIHVPTGKEPEVLIWPKPSVYKAGEAVTGIDPIGLRFHVNLPCDEIQDAINRFRSIVFIHNVLNVREDSIREVTIDLKQKYVDFVTTKDESYALMVPSDGSAIHITADNIYGAYHALNSLSFLIQYSFEEDRYIIKHAPYLIEDRPFFRYRGLLIDSSRHYLSIPKIKETIDAMSWVKMNVLHWHIVDDQAFPIQVPSEPKMWEGSYTKYERYSKYDVEDIVAYAKARGVHVVSEIDVPGHSSSWCKGRPDICPSDTCTNPLDPSNDVTFEVIDHILNDFVGKDKDGLFPGEFIHIGGDEVDTSCWEKVDHVKKWMTSKNYTANDAYGYFVNRVNAMVTEHKRETIAWEEVYIHHKEKIPKDVIIQLWLGDGERLKNVLNDGFQAIMSNYKHWYLPQLWETWEYYYGNDFLKDIPKEQWKQMVGGEICMWGETGVDVSDLSPTVYPRLIAAAERMWSQPEMLDISKATDRLAYMRCEYNRRGISASPTFGTGRSSPSGPGSCMIQ